MVRFGRAEGRVTIRLDQTEADALRALIGQMRLVLSDDRPGDPAIARLFPDAYEDERESAAFRDLVGDELRATKLAALDAVAATLSAAGVVERALTPQDADAWLRALTDLRLTLGARLQVDEQSMAADIDPNSPDAPALATLHWLGWLQESLIEQLAGEQDPGAFL